MRPRCSFPAVLLTVSLLVAASPDATADDGVVLSYTLDTPVATIDPGVSTADDETSVTPGASTDPGRTATSGAGASSRGSAAPSTDVARQRTRSEVTVRIGPAGVRVDAPDVAIVFDADDEVVWFDDGRHVGELRASDVRATNAAMHEAERRLRDTRGADAEHPVILSGLADLWGGTPPHDAATSHPGDPTEIDGNPAQVTDIELDGRPFLRMWTVSPDSLGITGAELTMLDAYVDFVGGPESPLARGAARLLPVGVRGTVPGYPSGFPVRVVHQLGGAAGTVLTLDRVERRTLEPALFSLTERRDGVK